MRQLNISKARAIIKQREWDVYFLRMAELVASKSKDSSLQVGCVIVGPDNEVRSTGYNGFCRGCQWTKKRMERPAKYDWTEHAERNAVFNAARMGTSTKDCTAYIACNPRGKGGNAPCLECTRALIQAGIKKIVEWNTPSVQSKEETGTWRDKVMLSVAMLQEAGVSLKLVATPEDCGMFWRSNGV